MYMETPRMIVRDFLPEDAAGLQEILGDAGTMEYCEPAYDFGKTEQFLADFCIGRRGAVAAVHRGSGKLIGYLLFHEFDQDVYEMGWIFHRAFWRQGYAYEACRAVIDHAFGGMHIHKIFAETIDAVKSVGLMEKLGMKPEGVQRKQTKDNQGTWADLYLYGLLEEDWREQSPCIRTGFSKQMALSANCGLPGSWSGTEKCWYSGTDMSTLCPAAMSGSVRPPSRD